MAQINKVMQSKEGKKNKNFLGIILAVLLIIIAIAAVSSSSSTDTEETTESTQTATSVMENLGGFKLHQTTPIDEVQKIYSYIHSSTGYITTVVVWNHPTTLDGRRENWPLDRQTQIINGVAVEFGFNDEDSDFVIQKYETLAFDFEYEGKYFSGEISNISGRPSKEKLIKVLNELIFEIAQG